MPKIKQILDEYKNCGVCPLSLVRNNIVFGRGKLRPNIMFIGEAPGADEDRQGLPFVGEAGRKLNELTGRADIDLDESYLTNILMCRPPNNKVDDDDWCWKCWPRLNAQIRAVEPKVIVLLGRTAARIAAHTEQSMREMRGLWTHVTTKEQTALGTQNIKDIPAIITYHPAFFLYCEKDDAPFYEALVIRDLIKAKKHE